MANVAITGAGRGIGLELASQHLAAGDRVFALVRNPASAETVRGLAEGSDGKLTVHALDVGDDASVASGAADTGGEPIDVLYNVAGVTGPAGNELEKADWAAWDETFRIMVQGPLRVTQAFLPRLRSGSKVIMVSSQLGASTWPMGGFYAYGAAKAALNRLSRSLALDLKDRGIVVGIVHPGWVQTDMGGPNAQISSEESATGLRTLADQWSLEESGEFKRWDGSTHPW